MIFKKVLFDDFDSMLLSSLQLLFQKLCLLWLKSFSNSEEEMFKDFPLVTSLSMAMIRSKKGKKMLLNKPDRFSAFF